jgi:hypothetical protein
MGNFSASIYMINLQIVPCATIYTRSMFFDPLPATSRHPPAHISTLCFRVFIWHILYST